MTPANRVRACVVGAYFAGAGTIALAVSIRSPLVLVPAVVGALVYIALAELAGREVDRLEDRGRGSGRADG